MTRHFIRRLQSFLAHFRSLRFVLAALVLATLWGCKQEVQYPLRVAIHPWPGYETLHLAQSLGYFDNRTIRLVENANASQTSMGMRNGTVDAGLMTLDEVLVLLQDNIDLRVIVVMDVSDGADVVMVRPEIKSLRALRGKRVAVENGAVGAIMLDALLHASGMQIGDIRLVSKTSNEHIEAYRNNLADAVVTFEPIRSELLKLGARELFNSRKIPGRIVDVLAVRADAMKQQQPALLALAAAHFQALDYLARQPQDAAKRIAPFLGGEAEVLAQFDGLKLPSLAENRAWLATRTPGLKTGAANLAGLMLKRKLLQRQVNVENLAEPMFLPQGAQ